ncbi:MAG: thermonuclease family protein [Candidatus Omnitrophota bacterium]
MKNTRILASLLIASLMLPGCRPKPAETAAPDEYRVTWVVDGDTIELGNGKRVRYLGIDTPEVRRRVGGKWQYLPEKYAVEAKNYNDTLVRNKNVKLEFDTRKEDKYGRWLAYVYVNDKMVNAELLREGLASVFIIPPNVKL